MIDKYSGEVLDTDDEEFDTYEETDEYSLVCSFNYSNGAEELKLPEDHSKCSNSLKYIICFSLIQGWILQGENSVDIYEVVIKLFEECLKENSKYDIYLIVDLFKRFPKDYHKDTIRLMISMFDFNDLTGIVHHIEEFIFSIYSQDNEKIIMDHIGEKLLLSNQSLRGKAMTGFFDKFSLDVVKEWIEKEPIERVPLIAYHSASPNLSNKSLSPLTKYLLTTFENDIKVYNDFILGGYNFVGYVPKDFYEKKMNGTTYWVNMKTQNLPVSKNGLNMNIEELMKFVMIIKELKLKELGMNNL